MARLGFVAGVLLAAACRAFDEAHADRPVVVPTPAPTARGTDAPASDAIHFEPFGPVPGTDPAQLALWTGWLRERYLGRPGPERLEQLEDELAALDVVDATPAFLNSVLGLEMSRPEHIEAAAAIAQRWYEGQARYKQVILDGDVRNIGPVHVRGRLGVVDGWVRLWRRTIETPETLARYRRRVAELKADLERIREQKYGAR